MLRTCATCGQPMTSIAAFCGNCGRPAWRACPHCGGPTAEGARWCGTCGADLAEFAGVQGVVPPPQPAPAPLSPAWAIPVAGTGRAGTLKRSVRRRPVLIAGAAVAVVAVLVAATVFGGRLPWSAASIPLVDTPMQGPTVIDVVTDDSHVSVSPGNGGRIDSEGAAIVIPAGAVASDTTVTAKVLQVPFHMSLGQAPQDGGANAQVVGPTVDFGPAGTKFNQPVTVSVPYDRQFMAGLSEDSIAPAYWNGQAWVVLPGVVDKEKQTVSVKLNSFDGVALMTIAVAAGMVVSVGLGLKAAYQNWKEFTWSDPVTKGTASSYITPQSTAVQQYAAEAVITDKDSKEQKAIGDPKMAEWLAAGNASGHHMELDYRDPSTGTTLATTPVDGKGSNWQKPDDFFRSGADAGPMSGDCTDEANSAVSVLIASGFKAKAVFGYNAESGQQHAWAEVAIGGQLYKMDEAGGIYTPDNWKNLQMYNPALGTFDRHANSMWDDKGQAPYNKDWWKNPARLSVTFTSSEGVYTFQASATGIPATATAVQFKWDYGGGIAETKDYMAPYAEPLDSSDTHEFADENDHTVTVYLYDMTGQTQQELARATVIVEAGASPSPTVSPSAAPTPLVCAGGGVSDTIVYGSHTLTYTVTGVTTCPGDTPAHRKGTVTGATVTVSGSVLYDGSCSNTNLSMSASLSVTGGESKSSSWPPEGVPCNPTDQTINFPFSLQVTIPPSSKPGATVSFSIRSQNCNDSGVCGGTNVDGDFLVVPGAMTLPAPDLGSNSVGIMPLGSVSSATYPQAQWFEYRVSNPVMAGMAPGEPRVNSWFTSPTAWGSTTRPRGQVEVVRRRT
jgi:hypothetical protein